jgi:hypothetical protein
LPGFSGLSAFQQTEGGNFGSESFINQFERKFWECHFKFLAESMYQMRGIGMGVV